MCTGKYFEKIMSDDISFAIKDIAKTSDIVICYDEFYAYNGSHNKYTKQIIIKSSIFGYVDATIRMFVTLVHELFHFAGYHNELEVSTLTRDWLYRHNYVKYLDEANACIERTKYLA